VFKRTPVLVSVFLVLLFLPAGVAFPAEWSSLSIPPDIVNRAQNGKHHWGGWFLSDGIWIREAVAPDEEAGKRFFADVNGNWFTLEEVSYSSPVPSDPPEWYPWHDSPEQRGLPPKGKDEILSQGWSRSFTMGEWENVFGGWFRRIRPPGHDLVGASHLIDSRGLCYVLVVFPGAMPRAVELFPWFPGFPPGWGIRPGTTVLVEIPD